jgi:hypothetical protein
VERITILLAVSALNSQSRVALPAQMFPPLVWVAAGMVGAVVVSVAASVSPAAALAATVAIAAVVLVAARPATLPLILVVSIFMELVRMVGATISRVLAPIALLVVLVQLIRGKASIRPAAPLYWAAAYGLWALASGLWTTSMAGTMYQLSVVGRRLHLHSRTRHRPHPYVCGDRRRACFRNRLHRRRCRDDVVLHTRTRGQGKRPHPQGHRDVLVHPRGPTVGWPAAPCRAVERDSNELMHGSFALELNVGWASLRAANGEAQ